MSCYSYFVAGSNDDNGSESGSGYVFHWDGSSWVQQQKLLPSDGAGGDRFGHGVSISGGMGVVGAVWDDDNGPDSGSAYIFDVGPPIPGVSDWGLVTMALLLLTAGTLAYARHSRRVRA